MTGKFGGYEYHDFVAEFYDASYDVILSRNDVDFYIDYAVKGRGRTLEIGCGTGRVLIPAAVAGYEITGLDLSPHMLRKCREKLTRQPETVQQRVKLVEANMTDFNLNETYSLVTIPFRAFQHLITADEQKACLGCISKHLVSDGQLIIDVFNPYPPRLVPNPEYEAEIEDVPETELPDGRKFRRTNRTVGYHRTQQCNDVELIYYVSYPDGRTERLVQSFPMRYYFRYEMEHLLKLCGFKVVELFGNFDRSELSDDSPEMIYVVKKAG